MQRFQPEDVQKAIEGIRSQLGLSAKIQLQKEFDSGLHPNLLAYGKFQTSPSTIPIIEKYLIGATSFLHQPSNYYDIFRACRCVYLAQVINSAITVLRDRKTPELETKLNRLVTTLDNDAFDSVVFELATASQYSQHPEIKWVEFIKETPSRCHLPSRSRRRHSITIDRFLFGCAEV